MKKRFTALTLCIAVLLSMILSGCGRSAPVGAAVSDASGAAEPAKAEPTVWKYSITTGEGSTWYKAATWFKDELEKRSDGRYTIEIYPNEQLSNGNMTTSAEMNINGSIDILMLSTFIYTQFDDVYNIVNTPFLFPTYDDLYRKLYTNGGADILVKAGENLGIHPISVTAGPYRGWSGNKGFYRTPADFDNVRFRTCGINLHVKWFTQLGADPIAMNFSEVFTSLQNGTLDACEGIYDTYISGSLSEVQEYYTESNYNPDVALVSFSDKVWSSLSPEDQALVTQLGKDFQEYFFQLAQSEENTRREEVEKAMQLYKLTDEEKQVFIDASRDIYIEYKPLYSEEALKVFEYPY